MKFGFAGTCFLEEFISKLPFGSTYKVLDNNSDVKSCDIIIFTGGGDVTPLFYGESNLYSYSDTERDTKEFHLLDESIKLNKTIVGVCRGHQLINVALGGNLYQDIYNDLGIRHHSGKAEWKYSNPLLSNLYININSLHHQAVRKLGERLTPIAFAEDGIIEALISSSKKIITFQFHPELLTNTRRFFNQLVENPSIFF
jgi:putative glutamine amidotransferase